MSKVNLAVVSKRPQNEFPPSTLQLLNIKLPKTTEVEEAVIGALMLDKNAFENAKQFLTTSEVFSDCSYQTAFRAMKTLITKGKPIDLLTVNEQIKKMGLLGDKTCPPENLKGRKLAEFQKYAITSYHLVELTNRVASTANVEYHAAILHQTYMRRSAVQKALNTARQAANDQIDIFKTYDEVVRDFRSSNPAKVIKLKTMNEAMEAGRIAPPSKWLAGNLIKENEVCILFADAGDGKSVLAFQIADAISKGHSMFRNCDIPDFINQCEPKLSYFYDFELEESELFGRYSLNGEAYDFSDNFVRGQLDPNFMDFENADELIANEIQRDIEIHQPGLVVIDNLTYIIAESQDSAIATKLMKRLLGIQKRSKQPLTIVVIAHTPKRDPSMPILMRNLAGSMNLANFAKSIVAVSKSSQDPDKRYIKHIKCRNGRMMHGHDNVIECLISKTGARLEYEFLGFSKEAEHLQVYDNREAEQEAIEKAYEMRQHGASFRDIAKKLKELGLVFWSYGTIIRKLKAYNPETDDPIFDNIDAQLDASDAEDKAKKEGEKIKAEREKLVSENTNQTAESEKSKTKSEEAKS